MKYFNLKNFYIPFVFFLSILFIDISNRHFLLPVDNLVISQVASDSYSYVAIAQAYPTHPSPSLKIPFHHAQRFGIPYAIGFFSSTIRMSIHRLFTVTTMVSIFIIGLLFITTIKKLGIESQHLQALLIVLLVCSPYTFRNYLAVPYLVNDLTFEVGLLTCILGLIDRSILIILIGCAIEIFSRQTALMTLPFIALWTLVVWPSKTGGNKRAFATLTLVLVVSLLFGIYIFTGKEVKSFAGESINFDHLIGVFIWFRNSFNLLSLAEFLLRAVIGFLFPAAILLFCFNGYDWRGFEINRAILLFFLSISIMLQPILGGPELTGSNCTRLAMLGFSPFLLTLGLVIKNNRPGYSTLFRLLLCTALFTGISSFQHVYSIMSYFHFYGLSSFLGLYFSTLAGFSLALRTIISLKTGTSE